MQLKQPMTVHSTSPGSEPGPNGNEQYEVPAGSWLVMHSDGTQSFQDDTAFSEIYEEVPVKRGPGRPPRGTAAESVAAPKRRRRRRHRAKVAQKQAA